LKIVPRLGLRSAPAHIPPEATAALPHSVISPSAVASGLAPCHPSPVGQPDPLAPRPSTDL